MAPWPLFAVIYHAIRSGDADWLKAISIAVLFFLFLPTLLGVSGPLLQFLAVFTLVALFIIGREQE